MSNGKSRANWELAIGRAFVAFGSIEHATVIALQEVPKERIWSSTKALALGQRIDLLLELLEQRSGDPAVELAKLLARAKAMSETRNLIAHNPLVLDVYASEGGSVEIRESIASLRKDRHISLLDLQEFASEAEALASSIYGSLDRLLNGPP